jgi:hypothetical protein
LLTAGQCLTNGSNPYPSNFYCNPSRIDGLSITDSSQGGGGIFVHGWAHYLEISNNRIFNNQGTLAGGIVLGQGEHPPGYVTSGAIELPGSCETTNDPQYQMPYCFNVNAYIHNNDVSLNSSEGDELFSSSPAGAGGIAVTSGADYYKLSYNWVCGNMSTGDGGGVSQLGFVKNADIEHNTIIFNQTKNPTIPTNGGGLLIMGAPDTDAICNVINPDTDCPTGLGDGAGPGTVINANLIQGNSADSGAGGGLRLQHINGAEVSRYPTSPSNWYSVSITNNIIINNVAGWDGGGVSLQDAMLANLVNNTIAHNDATAASGTLFQTFRRDLTSSTPPNSIMGTCDSNSNGCTASARQPAGVSIAPNSPYLIASFPTGGITCPPDHPNCAAISDPVLYNNILWQNRSFHIELGPLNQAVNQTSVSLTPLLNQAATGACASFPSGDYWDLGVRGDQNAQDNSGTGFWLRPFYSIVTTANTNYNASNKYVDPAVQSQYCNGSKVPPEFGGYGFAVPPGTDEGNVYSNHYFTLTPGATTDESNNWINISWGPLAMSNLAASTTAGVDPDNPAMANYIPNPGSPVLDAVPPATVQWAAAPTTDFFGNPRKITVEAAVDIGAVELPGGTPPTLTSIAPTSGITGTTVSVTLTGTNLTSPAAITFSGTGISASNVVASGTTLTAQLAIALTAPAGTQSVTVVTDGGTATLTNAFTVVRPTITAVSPTSGARNGSVNISVTGSALTGATGIGFAGNTGAGITVSNFTVVSDTNVTATLTIASNATLSTRNLFVQSPYGNTNSLPFNVVAPSLASITPNTGIRGSAAFGVTITGAGLTGATGVTVAGGGFTVTQVTVVNSTTVTASFAIASNAALGARNVSVATPGGTATGVTFAVTAPVVPTLTSVTPNTGVRGTSVPVNLVGTGFAAGMTAAISGTGVTSTAVTVTSPTTATATFTITAGATTGSRNVTVRTVGGTSNAVTFTVQGPTLTAINPTSGAQGSQVSVTLTGTNLTGATAVNVSGTGVTASTPVVSNNGTTVTSTLTITASAGIGNRTVTVNTPIGTSSSVTFAVTRPPAPTLATISPTSGTRGSAPFTVTLTGTNFLAGATTVAAGTGVTVTGVSVASPTQLTATFTIAPGTTVGNRTVTVTTSGGNSNGLTFAVANPPAPTLISIIPNSGNRGTAVTVTLAGTNFTPSGDTISVTGGGGVTVSGITYVNATTLTATFTVSGSTTTGNRNMTVSTPGGTTSAVAFTVK